ncbi:MAG TPA: VOC family protein [Acidimicrobiia bacterium]|nr:VOC family protein [Acidimicrobiia bacterium]
MPIGLDHTILEVHDLAESLIFYRDVVGLEYKGKDGPFEGLLITPDLALDLYDEWPVAGPRHLAFAMDRATFEDTFERVRNGGIAYGDGPSRTENMKGPGTSSGVHGSTDSVYFKDPNGHILEILTYDRVPRS